jgi:bacterioferritin (cytochrome b1)
MGEQIDIPATINGLQAALPLQARDALAASIAAGAMPGPAGVALQATLRETATAELRDVERVAARLATLGATPTIELAPIELPASWDAAAKRLVKMQREALEALVEAIPAKADDPEGEATEHLLEHVIARKRDTIELLERALR